MSVRIGFGYGLDVVNPAIFYLDVRTANEIDKEVRYGIASTAIGRRGCEYSSSRTVKVCPCFSRTLLYRPHCSPRWG